MSVGGRAHNGRQRTVTFGLNAVGFACGCKGRSVAVLALRGET